MRARRRGATGGGAGEVSHPPGMLAAKKEGHHHARTAAVQPGQDGTADHSPSTATVASFRGPAAATTASSPSCWAASPTTPWSSTPTRRGPCACSSTPGWSRRCASARGPADGRPARAGGLAAGVAAGRAVRAAVGMTRHLLVTNDFPPKVGGIQSYLWELWRRLDPESFVVLTASSHPDAPAFDSAQAALGVRIVRVPESILFFPTPAALAHVRRCVQRARHRPRPVRPRPPARAARSPHRRALRGHPPRRRGHGARAGARRPCRAGPRAARRRGGDLGRAAIRPPRPAGRPGRSPLPWSRSPPASTPRPSSPCGRPSGVRRGPGSGCRPRARWWSA